MKGLSLRVLMLTEYPFRRRRMKARCDYAGELSRGHCARWLPGRPPAGCSLAANFLDHTHRLVPEDVARTNERAKHMVGERAQRVETALEGRGGCLLLQCAVDQVASRSMINGAASSIRWSATTSESTVLR